MLTAFKPEGETLYTDTNEPFLIIEQRARSVYGTVVDAGTNNLPRPFKIDTPAGTSTTFTEKVIAAR